MFFFTDECPIGTEWSIEGCTLCPLGYYRSVDIAGYCRPCQKGYTTLMEGSKNRNLCNIPIEPSYSIPVINGNRNYTFCIILFCLKFVKTNLTKSLINLRFSYLYLQ